MRIAAAISGGVDSLVAAFLLKEQGHAVFGIHFTHGYEKHEGGAIRDIARRLDIPIRTMECNARFHREVVEYFTATYGKGLTPNPCMVCNRRIKFGAVLAFGRKLGAEQLATGHYARVVRRTDNRFHLLKGSDPDKEQSYFLAFLDQEQLAAARFPLGEKTKAEVVEIAKKNRLKPAANLESQDVCFIRDRTYSAFLSRQSGFAPKPGPIEDLHGNVIGTHRGLHAYTVGQRRGIDCPATEPYYVVRLDPTRNRLIVGFRGDLMRDRCRVSGINWIGEPPVAPTAVHAKLRYRSHAVASILQPEPGNRATLRFESHQASVTPGQAAVFYRDEAVLGGGWIEPYFHAP